MLTKTDRWGEKKGQCGESEREREKQMAAERILLGAAGSVESQKMSAEGGHREREGRRTGRKPSRTFKYSTC